jgi:hypothetical protein
MMQKPTVKLIGVDSNVFNIIGLTKQALRRAGLHAQAEEFMTKAFNASGGYDEVLRLVQEYCEVE